MNRTSVALLCAALTAFFVTATGALGAPRPSPTPVMMPTPTPPTYMPGQVSASPSPSATLLTLSQAEDIALATSPQLALARAVVNQEQAGEGIARSGELPSINASGTTTRSESTARFAQPSSTSSPSTTTSAQFLSTSNNASVALNQLILDGGHVAAEVQAARYSTDSAKLTLLRDIQTVLLTVAQDYFAALEARHQLAASVQSLSVAKVQYQLVEAQYRAGVASHADVLTAQLPVAQAELAVSQAQNGEAENVASLLDTMGLPANTPVTLQDDTTVSASHPNLDQLMASALLERTDLAAAQASVNSSQADVRAAKLLHFPVISGTAATGTSSTATNGGAYAPSWSLGASLNFPIYTGGLIKSEIDQAEAQEAQAQANYTTTRLGVYLNVQQAYLSLITAASSLTAAKAALDQARVVLDVTNAQYKAGVTTLPLLLNAQSSLTTAQSNWVQALYSYKVAQQNLLYSEGTLAPS
jgi:outer membrane protein